MIKKNIQEHHELWKSIVINLVILLAGNISKSVRGVSLDFDRKVIKIIIFYEKKPAANEVSVMQDIEAELISHHEYGSELVLEVVGLSERIEEKSGSWGWVFLRAD